MGPSTWIGSRVPGSSTMVQFSVPPPVLPTVNGCVVVVLAGCVLARLSGLTSMFGAVTACHREMSPGTITRLVPLPGPGSGSLLVTHRWAV